MGDMKGEDAVVTSNARMHRAPPFCLNRIMSCVRGARATEVTTLVPPREDGWE
jgi:hypothetical protein